MFCEVCFAVNSQTNEVGRVQTGWLTITGKTDEAKDDMTRIELLDSLVEFSSSFHLQMPAIISSANMLSPANCTRCSWFAITFPLLILEQDSNISAKHESITSALLLVPIAQELTALTVSQLRLCHHVRIESDSQSFRCILLRLHDRMMFGSVSLGCKGLN